MIGVGVIGFGYWGPNLVRNFAETPGFKLAGISDLSADRRSVAESRYAAGGVKVHADYKDLLRDTAIDAVAIATPVGTHYELASAALKAGKHVLLEKPMTATVDESRRLVDEAAAAKRILMVDHTFVYTGAVRKIKELVSEGVMGDLLYYDSVRVNLGLFQHDVNVVWDLAPHDASILDFLLDESPVAVQAMGISHVAGKPENMAYVTITYASKFIAHLHVNWLAPVKLRQTLIGGSKKMVVYDDVEVTEKIKIYDKGIDVVEPTPERAYELRIGYRSGDMHAPKIDGNEALRTEAKHFAECIAHNKTPMTDGEAGLRVVKILAAASRSMAQNGRPVTLGSDS